VKGDNLPFVYKIIKQRNTLIKVRKLVICLQDSIAIHKRVKGDNLSFIYKIFIVKN